MPGIVDYLLGILTLVVFQGGVVGICFLKREKLVGWAMGYMAGKMMSRAMSVQPSPALTSHLQGARRDLSRLSNVQQGIANLHTLIRKEQTHDEPAHPIPDENLDH